MSRKIRTVILDDIPGCIETLENDLSVFPEIQIVGKFTFPAEASSFIIYNNPDLLFLDIEMPDKTGVDFLQEISPSIKSEFAVVFYSAYDKYMLDAIRQSAFDFLLKPYKQEELALIINRIKEKIGKGDVTFKQSLQQLQTYSKRFAIRTKNEILMVDYSQVIYFEFVREERCWKAVLTDRSVYDLRTTATKNDICNISTSFVQVNKKNIINIDYLAAIDKGTKQCIFYPPFSDISHIIFSSGYYPGFKDDFNIL